MLQKECTIIPDGTGRKVIGKVGSPLLQVEGKARQEFFHFKARGMRHEKIGQSLLTMSSPECQQCQRGKDLLLSGPWPPAVGEHLATIKMPQFIPQICEFLGFTDKNSLVDENLRVKIYTKCSLNVPNNLLLWQDSDSTEYLIANECSACSTTD